VAILRVGYVVAVAPAALLDPRAQTRELGRVQVEVRVTPGHVRGPVTAKGALPALAVGVAVVGIEVLRLRYALAYVRPAAAAAESFGRF
jgi:hypothetical protein